MSLLQTTLNQIETRLQTLIEGSAALLFPGRLNPQRMLAQRLVAAMNAGIRTGPDGSLLGPNLYMLSVNPALAQFLQDNHALVEELALFIYESGTESGLHFPSNPIVKIVADPAIDTQDIQIAGQVSLVNPSKTSSLTLPPEESIDNTIPKAFLIVNGSQTFPLTGSTVNIGRREDNHLIIEDLRVSRSHAQLRAIRGRYMIFDLNSTGGTFVNGKRVTQSMLYPGDVISLAGVPLIYGQETSIVGDTQELLPPQNLKDNDKA